MSKFFLDTVIATYEKKTKTYNIIGLSIVGVMILLVVYKFLYKDPKEQEAAAAIYRLQYEFSKNDTSSLHYQLILNGEGGKFRGAVSLADNFSDTKAGNLASFYAGYAYYALGQYGQALKYLESCSVSDPLLNGRVLSVKADVYAEKGDFSKAANLYEDALELVEDNLLYGPTYALRAGILFTKAGKTDQAIAIYQKALHIYPHESLSEQTSKLIAPSIFEEIRRNLASLQ